MERTFIGRMAMEGSNELVLLNRADQAAEVELTFYYAGSDPVGPYRITVEARRLRRVRINDLIDPLPVPLETDYAVVVRASRRVTVSFSG